MLREEHVYVMTFSSINAIHARSESTLLIVWWRMWILIKFESENLFLSLWKFENFIWKNNSSDQTRLSSRLQASLTFFSCENELLLVPEWKTNINRVTRYTRPSNTQNGCKWTDSARWNLRRRMWKGRWIQLMELDGVLCNHIWYISSLLLRLFPHSLLRASAEKQINFDHTKADKKPFITFSYIIKAWRAARVRLAFKWIEDGSLDADEV